MKIKNIAVGLLLAATLASCGPQRDTLSYFQDIQTETFNTPIDLAAIDPKIEPHDELLITISSLKPELTLPYNLPLSNPASSQNGFITGATPAQSTYIVTPQGDITMPILGKMHVAGMTVDQLSELITQKLTKDVADPVVVVKMINFKINVGGEVTSPGQYKITDRRFSILDAISTAGDLTPYGERTKVLLIREEDGQRVAHNLDLTSAELLTSPYFYLKQNDYIYVAPNTIRNDNSKYNQNNAFKLSVISTIVSGVSVVASLVIALVIK